MARSVDRIEPSVPFHEPLPLKDVELAKKLQEAIHDFRDAVKHLNHSAARSSPSLAQMRKIIKHLDQISHQAAKIRER